MLKVIFRNKTAFLYFFIGVLTYIFFLIIYALFGNDILHNWQVYVIASIGLNILNTSYVGLYFSFDYNVLLNKINCNNALEKHIYNKILVNLIFISVGSMLFYSYSIIIKKPCEFVVLMNLFVNEMAIIPIGIFFSIITLTKIDLFSNQFIIIKQNIINYLFHIIFIFLSLLFYYLLLKNLFYVGVFILIAIYSIFIVNYKKIVQLLKNKIKNEYIRS